MMNKPTISACIIAYNHERFIKDALNGAISQKTKYEYEIVVGEDHSSDETLTICEEYEKNYELVKIIKNENNLGMIGNWINTITTCKGKYIAICEGDDFWIDPLKLQKQVDFLESNPDYVMSFHPVNIQYEYSPKTDYSYPTPPKDTLKMLELLKKHYIPTCSLVFRKNCLPNPFPAWYKELRIGDIPLEIMISEKGLTKYHTEAMAIHRKNECSITHNENQKKEGRKTYLRVYQNLNKHFNYKYWKYFSIMILRTRLGKLKDIFGLNNSLK